VRDAVLLGANGQVLASAGGSSAALMPERPTAALLRQARSRPTTLRLGESTVRCEGWMRE
jgi:hypothetical protein